MTEYANVRLFLGLLAWMQTSIFKAVLGEKSVRLFTSFISLVFVLWLGRGAERLATVRPQQGGGHRHPAGLYRQSSHHPSEEEEQHW